MPKNIYCIRIKKEDYLKAQKRKSCKYCDLQDFFAEREGFEPPVPLGTVVFKTTVIDHSTISPLHWGNRGFLIAGAKVRRKNETTKFFGNYFAKKMHFTCFLSSA